jgi:glutamyl/glutaminyl-tRNA synthetase
MMVEENKQLSKFTKEELKSLLEQTITALETSEFTPDAVQDTLNQLLETTGQKPGVLFSLIRLAVSWAPFSPALNDTLAVLGQERVHQRLQAALDAAS